jgi:hypothetical protein
MEALEPGRLLSFLDATSSTTRSTQASIPAFTSAPPTRSPLRWEHRWRTGPSTTTSHQQTRPTSATSWAEPPPPGSRVERVPRPRSSITQRRRELSRLHRLFGEREHGLAASGLQASGFRGDVTVFRLNAADLGESASEPAFRRNTAERVYTTEAAHNPEVAGSNPAPATQEGPGNRAFSV